MKNVIIKTNRPQYLNDIGEEIRLFFGKADVVLYAEHKSDEDGLLITVFIDECAEEGKISAYAAIGTDRIDYAFVCDDFGPVNVKRLEKRALKVCVFRVLKQMYPVDTPWGSLTGIRPTKLFREITKASDETQARISFETVFDVSKEKTKLAEQINSVQKAVIESGDSMDVDIYFNIPFCRSKCLYCSFPSEILNKKSDPLTPYLEILKKDISSGASMIREKGYRLRCMYVGGGTPTVLSAVQLKDFLSFVIGEYGSLGTEITVEAGRPDTIDAEKLQILHDFGVGRISINPQTMNDETLKRIGRTHSSADTEEVFELARKIGFSSINMDVICGLPGERCLEFEHTMNRIKELAPDNLTVHTLALKRSSRLMDHLNEYPLPESKEVMEMVSMGMNTAEKMGMVPYYMYRQKYMNGNLENVGYALPNKVCVYNIDMMEETTNILAHGASAMTKRVYGNGERVERIPNPKDVPTYCAKLGTVLAQKEMLF